MHDFNYASGTFSLLVYMSGVLLVAVGACHPARGVRHGAYFS